MNIPRSPLRQLQASKSAWDKAFGETVQLAGWSYLGKIGEPKRLNEVFKEMTRTHDVWFPSWDASIPNKIALLRIPEDPTVDHEAITKWTASVRDLLHVGQHVIRIEWKAGKRRVETTCIASTTTILYDSILTNMVNIAHHSRCLDYRIGWMWQTTYSKMTRGKIWADCTATCKKGQLISCDDDCGGDCTGGDAKCLGNSVRIADTDCCRLTYSWGWTIGLKSVKVSGGVGKLKGSVSIKGYIGSSGSGNGACSCCCEPEG
jgi:hypothetical protein